MSGSGTNAEAGSRNVTAIVLPQPLFAAQDFVTVPEAFRPE
jgi:hypothetical protein